MKNSALIITTIASPNDVLKSYASASEKYGFHFIAIGDRKSPADFTLDHCDYWSLTRQLNESDSRFARLAPVGHYGRKNLGYILAARSKKEWIIETDDDNFPLPGFWQPRQLKHQANLLSVNDWVNAYAYFSETDIWPRGFALEKIMSKPDFSKARKTEIMAPIQQGLADENPDVDAVFRLTRPLPVVFDKKPLPLALGPGAWCPFNSQNTSWHRSTILLAYLPSYCSFRMTDIWRSFIAQRIAWENKWPILFHNSTVYQERNEHSLIGDFKDEVSGYLNNHKICDALSGLSLKGGEPNIANDLMTCYEKMVSMDLVGREEIKLIESFISDMTE